MTALDATLDGRLPVAGRVRPGRLPDPGLPKIEGAGAGGDRHLLMVDKTACRLWELLRRGPLEPAAGGRLRRDLGPPLERAPAGRLDLRRRRRPADLPRASRATTRSRPGAIAHALRFTVPTTRDGPHLPGPPRRGLRIERSSLPPMGLRVRLKASVEHQPLTARRAGSS